MTCHTLRAAARLGGLLNADRLPNYLASINAVRPPEAAGLGHCHENTSALATDLLRARQRGWVIVLGERTEGGPHSWMEYGESAIDTAIDGYIQIGLASELREYQEVTSSVSYAGRAGLRRYLEEPELRAIVV